MQKTFVINLAQELVMVDDTFYLTDPNQPPNKETVRSGLKLVREFNVVDNERDLVHIKIPFEGNPLLCAIFMDYLSTCTFKKYAKSTQINYARYIVHFFSFLSKNSYEHSKKIPSSVLADFVYHLKDERVGYETIRQASLFITKVIKLYALDSSDVLNHEHRERLWLYLSKAITVRAKENNPRKSMSAYFNTDYSDSELIRSLRLVCSWILLEHDRQRSKLLNDKLVKEQLAAMKKFPVDSAPFEAGRLYAGNTNIISEEISKQVEASHQAYYVLLKSIVKSNDEVILERVVSGFKHNLGDVLSKELCKTVIERMFGLGKNSQKNLIVTNLRLPKHTASGKRMIISWIKSITFRDLVAPSEVEVFAAQCIFASERIQASNQARQVIDDVELNSDGLQAQHAKGRSNKSFATAIYGSNTLIESALKKYIESCKHWRDWSKSNKKDTLFPYCKGENAKRRGVVGQYRDFNWRFFESLVTPGTATYKKLISDVSIDDSAPFIQWLSSLINHNRKALIENSGKGCIGLSISLIGQSRNYMESSLKVVEKPSTNVDSIDDPMTSSDLRAHSLNTRRRVYDDRDVKEHIDNNFARKVAELMEQDAYKIGKYLKKTKVVNLNEAKQLLGCEDMQADMQSLLQKADEEIGLTAEIIRKNETIFIANELTAALLHLRITHINNEIPKLLIDTPSKSKALNAALTRTYLEKVLEQFPSSIVKSGKSLSTALDVSFEALI